jgi:type IX secretion system PorP/SprF family membrane protein
MKKIILLAGILILCGVCKTEAQQIPQFSQYMFNGLYVNPAYAGYKDVFYGHIMYRKQWAGEGTPQTAMLSVDGSLSKGSNVGLVYVNDKIGAIYSNSVMLDYAYRFKVSEGGRLSLGLAAGLTQHGVNRSKLSDEQGNIVDAQALAAKSVLKPGFDFGLYYDTKNFYAGFSIVGLIGSKTDEDFAVVRTEANYFLTFGGAIKLNDKLKLLPSTLLKSDFDNPLTIDLNAMLMVADRFSIGGSYRTGILWFTDVSSNTKQRDAISLIAEVYATDRIRVGFAYDFDLNKIKAGYNGGFEISLGYYINKPKENKVTPRYF